jgi:3-deoxy-D-arabino-heptulosonate 7-phosphate (DAHP) synthase class II
MEYADDEIDVASELAPHLAEGSVAVLEQVGAEKLRYLSGWAEAVNHRGEKILVTLDDVYEKAKAAGWPEPTRAVY